MAQLERIDIDPSNIHGSVRENRSQYFQIYMAQLESIDIDPSNIHGSARENRSQSFKYTWLS